MLRAFILSFLLIIIISCAGKGPSPDFYKAAKEKYDDEDYFEAVNDFTVVLLRFAGSSIADSAQFYLADSHYKMGEYLIAAVEFEKLVNTMAQSSLVPMAQYKIAESYNKLSPRSSLDQEYTLKSIRYYQIFIEENPTHELKEKAEKKIFNLRNKLAKKEWQNAEIYRKMDEFDAAIIYFDQVLAKYYDTDWADDAQFGKIRTYLNAEDPEKAQMELVKFEQQFPSSELLNEVEKLKPDITALFQEAEQDE